MRHIDHELLAGVALGESGLLTRRDRMHLRICRECASELAELRAITATGRDGMPYELRPPRPAVLALIQAELAEDGADVAYGGSTPTLESPASVERSPGRATPPARRLTAVAIAAAALAAVSVGGVIWYRQTGQDDAVVVARATLQPLPDKAGSGTAELVRAAGGDQLRVNARAEGVRTGFEELWLINTDGKRMISLGVLPPDGQASYPVPTASGGGLDGYTIVDISLEPFDGDAAHSRNSLLRGSLD
jgi:hypothetical protein